MRPTLIPLSVPSVLLVLPPTIKPAPLLVLSVTPATTPVVKEHTSAHHVRQVNLLMIKLVLLHAVNVKMASLHLVVLLTVLIAHLVTIPTIRLALTLNATSVTRTLTLHHLVLLLVLLVLVTYSVVLVLVYALSVRMVIT